MEEQKNFLVFSHIYKTEKKYNISESTVEVNIFDFEKYLEQGVQFHLDFSAQVVFAQDE